MELDLGIEVSEVNFEEFERRKDFRGSGVFSEVQRNAYFADKFYEKEHIRIEVYTVTEVDFDQFERRKSPR
jgi:hypothetical protein